jgi:hypothetical protein
MEEVRIHAQSEASEAGESETVGSTKEVCGNGACPRQGRGRFSGTNQTKGVDHGKA